MDWSNLLGEDSSFTNLSSSEKDILKQILYSEMVRREEASKPVQIRDIVDIKKWIESEYFVGPDVIRIYDYWKELICDIFDPKRTTENRINEVILSGALGVGKSCINSKTLIPTSLGILAIEELYNRFHNKGERFKVLAESGWKDCIDVFDNGTAKTKIITMKSGRKVECTYNHKFRIIRDGNIEWVKSIDMVLGDKFLMTRKETPFGSNTMDLDEAYTLGYVVGDGWLSHNGNKKTYDEIGILYKKEQYIISERIEKVFSKVFGHSNIKEDILKNGNTLYCRRAFNVKIAMYLIEQGIGSKAENKNIPMFIFEMNKSVIAYFIRGLMDADGTVGKNGKISITLKSKKLIDNLSMLLSMFGISYTLGVKTLKIYGDFYNLLIINPKSYIIYEREIGFDVDYKKERLSIYVKTINDPNYGRNDKQLVPDGSLSLNRIDSKNHLVCDNKHRQLNTFRSQNYSLRQLRKLYKYNPEWISKSKYLKYICEEDVFFDEIISIEEGRCHTMDLTIDGDHSYCFSGFISHNTIGELILMRKLYELSCYKNINALFELMLKTHITFLYFSVNKTQAERTGFGEMRTWLDSSPYFNECFERNKRLDSIVVFPENILFAYGSGTQHSIGMSVLGSILDEANFFRGTEESATNKISELYSSIVNRANSRFIIQGGINYSLNILISSSTHESSFTEQRIAKSLDNPHVLVRSPTQWEVKPGKFSGKFFYVCKGTSFLEPFIIHSIDDVNQYRIAEGLGKCSCDDGIKEQTVIDSAVVELPEFKQADFLRVPIDLKSGFETNIMKSLQDMGGVSVAATGRLFNSKPVYLANCRDYLKHPFINDILTISTGDTIKIQDYIRKDFQFLYPNRPRYLHIDQSTVTDSTGIASVYIKEILEVDNLKKSLLGVDFMLRIDPPKPPKKIAIYKIRDFVVWLNVARKLKLGKVTYDIFNSEESRQILEEMGYNVGYASVDRNDKAYVDMVTMFYEERVEMYDYEPFSRELFTVIHDRSRRKVDHVKELGDGTPGSKDVSDALAGAISNALQTSFTDNSIGDGINDFLKANTPSIYDMYGGTVVKERTIEELVNHEIDKLFNDMDNIY